MNEYRRPSWWALYAIVPIVVAMLALETRLALSPIGHQIAQIGIVLLFMGLVGFWYTANADALVYEDSRQPAGTPREAHGALGERIGVEILQQQAVMAEAQTQTASAHSGTMSLPAHLGRERDN